MVWGLRLGGRVLFQRLERLASVHDPGTAAHVDGDCERLQDLLPRGAGLQAVVDVKRDAPLAADGDGDGKGRQLLMLRREGAVGEGAAVELPERTDRPRNLLAEAGG